MKTKTPKHKLQQPSPPMAPPFRTYNPRMTVQESLRTYIEKHGLKAGALLPSETELAALLGVSRNSLREGIKALESIGILEPRHGVGIFVKAFSFEALLENLPYGLGTSLRQIEEVIDIRRALEVGLIDKTIEIITEEDIAELRLTVEKMRQRAERGEAFPEEDKHFHHLLFRCQGNQILLRLIEVFWLAFYKASDFAKLNNPAPMQTWLDHVVIVDALEARDVEAARKHLSQHYTGINHVLNMTDLFH